MLFCCYLATLAPSVTFWDAGELIAAARTFGIPHPPGTPLYVALGRAWIVALGRMVGTARAMNLLSAASTAAAGALTAWLVAGARATSGRTWAAVAGAICAGLMTSAWANATEAEVYAVSLLHVALMLTCASKAADVEDGRGAVWTHCTAYAIALAPAVHLSALVGAPAAIGLAARRRNGSWHWGRAVLLGGVSVATAGVGRMSPWLVLTGFAGVLASGVMGHRSDRSERLRSAAIVAMLGALATTALLVLFVRARHDPAVNQGNPSTLSALANVVARRQYAVAGLLPRQAPVWLQLANVVQYADWQVAVDWGRGIFTTPARVLATLAFVALGAVGARALGRDDARLRDATLVLVLCGSVGVAAYLNLKAGASLGTGVIPADAPHEARERDYFFVLAFWGWGVLVGWGAVAFARRVGGAPWWSLAACVLPLIGNWRSADRSRAPDAGAARDVASALLSAAPRGAVLFAGGDNDSYPLWYAQQVEGIRPDLLVVTLPLLPADWYPAEIARRTGWRWRLDEPVVGARWSSEQRGALIARAARAAGRAVAATPLVTVHERSLLGSGWRLIGPEYVAAAAPGDSGGLAVVDRAAASRWLPARRWPTDPHRVDDVVEVMLGLLECPRLALGPTRPGAGRDSLEVKCNFQ